MLPADSHAIGILALEELVARTGQDDVTHPVHIAEGEDIGLDTGDHPLRGIRLDLDLRLDLFRFQTFDVCLECFFFHSFGPLCLVTDKYTAFPCVSHTPPLCDFSISTDFSDASGHRKRS